MITKILAVLFHSNYVTSEVPESVLMHCFFLSFSIVLLMFTIRLCYYNKTIIIILNA